MNIFISLQANIYYSCVRKKIFKISGVCFKITYLITNQNLFSTFKCNIWLINIAFNGALGENKSPFWELIMGRSLCIVGKWWNLPWVSDDGVGGGEFTTPSMYFALSSRLVKRMRHSIWANFCPLHLTMPWLIDWIVVWMPYRQYLSFVPSLIVI